MTASSFGEELRQLRQRADLSLRALARKVSFDYSYLSQVERGLRPGSAKLADQCDMALGTGGSLAAKFKQSRQEQEGDTAAMRRRTVLQALTALAAGAASAPLVSLEATRQGMTAAMGDRPGVDEWDAIVAMYTRDFYTTAPADLLRELTADLVVLQQVMDADRDDKAARDLARVGGQLGVVMAMTLASLGQVRTARRWWSTARQAADRSADPEIRVWVRDWEAVNGLYERRPIPQLLGLVEESLSIGAALPCSGTAGVLSGKAQALSVLGRADDARAALRELQAVCNRLPSSVISDECSMFGWPEYRLRHTESYVYTHLGDTAAAYAAQNRALALYPPELARERAQLEMHLARCMIIDGHVSDGINYGTTVLTNLPAQFHNELLYEVARKVTTAVPAEERGRPALADFQQMLALPAGPTSA